MKQPLFALLTLVIVAGGVKAQMPYTFSAFHQPYVPLTSGTIVSPGYIWNTNDYITIPIGFPFRVDTINCANIFLEGGGATITDTANVTASGFLLTDASLNDRAYTLGTTPLSPIRWVLAGTSPNRILKIEIFNAGFDQQLADSGFMTDSVNLQMWYYEDSNAVEFRYGPSHITGTDYFIFPTTIAGYMKDMNVSGNGTFYALGGNPNNPVVQTVPFVGGAPSGIMLPLSGFPANGQVYRFGRLDKTGVPDVFSSESVKVYPTCARENVTISYNGSEKLNYQVSSVSGSKMNIEGSAMHGSTTVNISELPSGVYLLRMQIGTDSKVYKFVKM